MLLLIYNYSFNVLLLLLILNLNVVFKKCTLNFFYVLYKINVFKNIFQRIRILTPFKFSSVKHKINYEDCNYNESKLLDYHLFVCLFVCLFKLKLNYYYLLFIVINNISIVVIIMHV